MIVSVERRPSKIDLLGRQWHVTVVITRCDQCMIEFEHSGSNVSRHLLREHHFCSKTCTDEARRKGNVINRSFETLCLERYGAISPLAVQEFKEKSKQTCMQKYGVHHPGAVRALIEQRKCTCLERYGKTTPLMTDDAVLVRKSVEYKEKHRLALSKVDKVAVAKKRHETMKRNNSYGKSKVEDDLYALLCSIFGESNVNRQVTVHTWPIDFFIVSKKTYVQLDGVYWHGLDRPLSEIVKYKNKRDIVIHGKMLTDERQNVWFAQNNMKLLRITDQQFKYNKIKIVELFKLL